jgi:hypothetical protein
MGLLLEEYVTSEARSGWPKSDELAADAKNIA